MQYVIQQQHLDLNKTPEKKQILLDTASDCAFKIVQEAPEFLETLEAIIEDLKKDHYLNAIKKTRTIVESMIKKSKVQQASASAQGKPGLGS